MSEFWHSTRLDPQRATRADQAAAVQHGQHAHLLRPELIGPQHALVFVGQPVHRPHPRFPASITHHPGSRPGISGPAGTGPVVSFPQACAGVQGPGTRDPGPASKILFSVVAGPGRVIPNNTHFDTTRANIEFTGAQAADLPVSEGLAPAVRHPFKGNMDVAALERLLAEQSDRVPLVMLTVTNNSGGGRPVSLANMRAVRAVCDKFGKALFLDACRFAKNAWFIKTREPGYAAVPVPDIVREMAALADGMTMSAKKDPLANIGGWLAVNDDSLARQCRNLEILTGSAAGPGYRCPGRTREGEGTT
jgi:Beta-eliminating lyase